MLSQLHEALLLLFRNRPQLAPELLRDALRVKLPRYSDVRLHSADLTEVRPAEYRADLVVLLCENDLPVLGILIEAQLQRRQEKRFSWPAYVCGLRDRLKCPVCLLVVTVRESVARWAARSIDLGGGNRFTPQVLGPSGVPVVTDEKAARDHPELAVLSAMAHGAGTDVEQSLSIALAAMAGSIGLDPDRSALYFDLVMASLSAAAKEALQSMDPAKYEYQSEFARWYFAKGQAEGEARGEARGEVKVVSRLLTLRFGPLPEAVQQRLCAASIAELDRIAERLLTAHSLEEALQ